MDNENNLVVPPDPAVTELLTGLGLDPTKVLSLTINFEYGDIVTITVKEYVTQKQVKFLPDWFNRWQTAPRIKTTTAVHDIARN